MGGDSFEIEVQVDSIKGIRELLNEIKEKFPIRSTEILIFKECHKLELIPEK